MNKENEDPVLEYLYQLKRELPNIKEIGSGGPGNPHVVVFKDEVYLPPEVVEKLFSLNYIITEVRGQAVTVSPLHFPDSGAIPAQDYDDHAYIDELLEEDNE